MRLSLRSLALRQALFTGAWVTVGLAVVWLWVASIVAQAAQGAFDARLVSLADALVAAVEMQKAVQR